MTCSSSGRHAAFVYSLIRPLRTGFWRICVSQIAFIRGAWTAVGSRILAPVAWKTASNEAVMFDPRSRITNLMSANRSSRARARRVAGPLYHPLAGAMCGNPAEVHPAGAVLDKHQDSVECSFVAVHRIRVTWESSQVRTAFGRQSLPRSDST